MANKMKKANIDDLPSINTTEPVEVNRDNGTQTFEDTRTEKVTEPIVVQGAADMNNVDVPTDAVRVDYIETPVVIREKRVIDEGNMANVIERYKASNPRKYEQKKEELKRKLKESRSK